MAERAKDMEYKPTRWRRGIDVFRERAETDASALEICDGLEKLRHGPTETVELPYDESVAVAKEGERLPQPGSFSLGTGNAVVFEDAIDTCDVQSVELQSDVLVEGRDTGVTDQGHDIP